MKAHFLKLNEYNFWANQRVWQAMNSTPSNDEIQEKFSHIALAETVWLDRLDGIPQAQRGIFELIPLSDLETMIFDSNERFVAQIKSAENFEKEIYFKRMDGAESTITLANILTHVFSHGTYHRGQVALMMRQNGIKPSVTDFIAFARTGQTS